MSLQVFTGCLKDLHYHPHLLDVTVKSGDPVFAPTWNIVMGHKKKRISDVEYVEAYVKQMWESYRDNRSQWEHLLNQSVVILGCYCRPRANFCHRFILAEILGEIGATVNMELMDTINGVESYSIPILGGGAEWKRKSRH